MSEATPETCPVCNVLDGIYDDFHGEFDYGFRSTGFVPVERLYVFRNGRHIPVGFACVHGHVVMDETFDGKGVGSYSSFELKRFGHDPKDPRWIDAFLANGPLHLPTPLEPQGSFVVCRATGALVVTNLGTEIGTLDSENA